MSTWTAGVHSLVEVRYRPAAAAWRASIPRTLTRSEEVCWSTLRMAHLLVDHADAPQLIRPWTRKPPAGAPPRQPLRGGVGSRPDQSCGGTPHRERGSSKLTARCACYLPPSLPWSAACNPFAGLLGNTCKPSCADQVNVPHCHFMGPKNAHHIGACSLDDLNAAYRAVT
jgi:hypothetical protein